MNYEEIMYAYGEYLDFTDKYGYDWERQFGPIEMPEYIDEIDENPNYSLEDLLRNHPELRKENIYDEEL